MIAVEQLIGDLLLRHNCVIIPSFGGFVASQTSATIDYVNGLMSPPKKALLFNRQLINNDGLLVSELAAQNTVSYDDALKTVVQLVEEWNQILRRGERINLDRIGHLYLDGERNICFEQDRFFNLLLESYGLGKVQFIAEAEIKKETVTIQPELKVVAQQTLNDTEEAKIIELPAIKKQTKVWRYVAAACLLPVAFYSFWIPMKTDVLESGMLSFHDFNPFHKSGNSIYSQKEWNLKGFPAAEQTLEDKLADLPEDVTVYSYPFADDLYIPVRVREKTNEIPSEVSNELPSAGQDNEFQFIVGCFGDRKNAENLVLKLRSEGFNASVAGEAAGLTRVSAGASSTEKGLNELISKAKSMGYTGWVLK
jgi:hypothetical protein